MRVPHHPQLHQQISKTPTTRYLILIHVSVPQSEQCHSFKILAFHFPLFFFGFKDRRKFSIIAYVLETHSKSNSSSIASYHMTALI
jgi:hypothetical protein